MLLRPVRLQLFCKFPGNVLCQSLFFIKAAGLACNFIKIETAPIKRRFCITRANCRFSYAGTWELVNLFFGAKTLATIFVMKT